MKGIGNMLKTSSRVQADIRDRQEKNQTVPSKETEDVSEFVQFILLGPVYMIPLTRD